MINAKSWSMIGNETHISDVNSAFAVHKTMKAPAVSHRLGSHTANTRKPKTGNTMRRETVY